MIGTTEFEYCKEKAMGIIADWLWVLAIIIGVVTGVIQRGDIRVLYQYIGIMKKLIIYCILAQGKRWKI